VDAAGTEWAGPGHAHQQDTAGNVFAVLNTATQEIEVERPLYMQSQQIYAVDNNASGLRFETREDHMVFVRLDTVNEHTAFTKPITFEGAAAGDRTVQLMDGLENAMFITGATEAGTVFVQVCAPCVCAPRALSRRLPNTPPVSRRSPCTRSSVLT